MKQLLHTTVKELDRPAGGTRATRWLMGPALGLLVAVAVVAFSAREARADPRDFTLINRSSVVITHVYVTRTTIDEWGDDVLGRDVLYPEESTDIMFSTRFSGWCLYDIKIVSSDDEDTFMWDVDLCDTTTVTFS